MPPIQMTDSELQALAAYLHSLRGPGWEKGSAPSDQRSGWATGARSRRVNASEYEVYLLDRRRLAHARRQMPTLASSSASEVMPTQVAWT